VQVSLSDGQNFMWGGEWQVRKLHHNCSLWIFQTYNFFSYRKDADITTDERLRVIENIRQGKVKVIFGVRLCYTHYFKAWLKRNCLNSSSYQFQRKSFWKWCIFIIYYYALLPKFSVGFKSEIACKSVQYSNDKF